MVRNDLPFLRQFKVRNAFFLELQRDADEAGRKIDPRNVLEFPRQLERSSSYGATQIQGFTSRTALHITVADRNALRGEIAN